MNNLYNNFTSTWATNTCDARGKNR